MNQNTLPHFIKARSPKGLLRLMKLNNFKLGGCAKYFDIAQAKDGNWYAWYFVDIDQALQASFKKMPQINTGVE